MITWSYKKPLARQQIYYKYDKGKLFLYKKMSFKMVYWMEFVDVQQAIKSDMRACQEGWRVFLFWVSKLVYTPYKPL